MSVHKDSYKGNHRRRGDASGLHFLMTFVFLWAVVFTTFVAPPGVSPSSAVTQILSDFKKRDAPPPILASPIVQSSRPEYHVLFSTGCSLQQHWESYVFFYHAFKVNQPGNVTRLVSGCTAEQELELRQFHEEKIRTMSQRFHVFFTRNFGTDNTTFQHTDYKYNNKPNSVYLWMKDILGMDHPQNRTNDVDDGIIFLLDPDMILLRPLLHDFSGQEMIYASADMQGASQPYNGTKVVRHGMPMAQHDGYLSSEWMGFNTTYITQGKDFPGLTLLDGELFWNSGPPYLSTVRDMWSMVLLWQDYVPRVYSEYPKLFAEMYVFVLRCLYYHDPTNRAVLISMIFSSFRFGLILAAATLDLPHTLVKSIVVSTTMTPYREGWLFVDNLSDDEVCDVQAWSHNPRMPIILHYCKRYFLGKFFFSKYRLKKKFISCDAPLLTMPPRNVHKLYDHWVRPPPDKGTTHDVEVKWISAVQAKREAFMLCGLIYSVNEASRYYKLQHCNGSGNFSEVYNFHDDPYS